jgi:phage terminase large subunit-like protein
MFPPEVVDGLKAKGSLYFAGQYQQRPTPAAGNMFKAAMFCRDKDGMEFWPYPESPIISAYLSWDTANKAKTVNDLSACCLTMSCADGFIYLIPLYLDRAETPKTQKLIALHWAQWKSVLGPALKATLLEDNGGGAVIAQNIRVVAAQRGSDDRKPSAIWTDREWEIVRDAPRLVLNTYTSGPGRDKVLRASEVLPFCEGNNVRIVDNPKKPLARIWLEALMSFPLDEAHDDAVDSSVEGIRPFIQIDDGMGIANREAFLNATRQEEIA